MFPNQSNVFSTSLSRSDNNGDFQSAGGRPQASGRGGKSFKNVVHVDIKTILYHREDDGPLMVHGIEVGLVTLVAQIRDVALTDVQTGSNTVTFLLDDDTGSIEAVQYLQDDVPPVLPVRNTWAKIVGSLKRSAGRDENMLTVFMVRPVQSTHEINAHLLEMAILPLQMTRLQGQAAALAKASLSSFYQTPARKNCPTNPGGHHLQHQPLQVRNIQAYPGFQQAPAPAPAQQDVFLPHSCPETFKILATVRSCFKHNGISRQEIYKAHMAEMTQQQVDERVDYLTSEGHIYTTIGLDHFKSTDS